MNQLTLAGTAGTGKTIKPLSVLLGLSVLCSACGGASIPTAPTPTTGIPTPAATYTLSGVVTEMTPAGPAPVEDARVLEARSDQAATTDASGLYSIRGLSPMDLALAVTKDGYITQTRTVAMTGDTQLDIRVERIASYTLSGVVFEITAAGQVPIEGVAVYCDSCGIPDGHSWSITDADGFYSLPGTPNGMHPLDVTKAGYEIADPTGALRDPLGRIHATVSGDTRFDIHLARR